MTNALTSVFGTIVLTMTYYNAHNPASLIAFFLNADPRASRIRAIVTVVVMAYCFAAVLRNQYTQYFMAGLGVVLLYIGISGLSSNLALTRAMLPMDGIFALEGGIIALLLSIELPAIHLDVSLSRLRTFLRPSVPSKI